MSVLAMLQRWFVANRSTKPPFQGASWREEIPVTERPIVMSTSEVDELYRLRRDQLAAAKADWEARRLAAIAAVPLPAAPYRLSHTVDPDHGVDHWVVEKAQAFARSYAQAGGRVEFPYQQHVSSGSINSFTAENYNADKDFAPTIIWAPLASKPLYDEAEAWLKAYLKPVVQQVYFTDDGEPATAEAA